jgi:RND family efflux transporter MFP subunit
MSDNLPDTTAFEDEVSLTRTPLRWVLGRVVVPAAILAGAVGVVVVLKVLSTEAERTAPPPTTPSVDVVTMANRVEPLVLHATGTTRAAERVAVVPEVSGRVTWIRPGLAVGTRVRAGETIARVDATTYEALVAAEEARVRQARLERELEAGRGAVASREWEILGSGADSPLARRVPQGELADANVVAAERALARARRDLARTSITAPFDAVVVDEALEVGQVVGPTGPVATLLGTDKLHVVVDVDTKHLPSLPVKGPETAGARALVAQELGEGAAVEREGVVVALLGQLDPQTRRAQLLVEVPDPYGAGPVPLLPNAYVDVALVGVTVPDALDVPRVALVDGAKVWTVSTENTLESRDVEIGWADQDSVVVTGGLAPGDRVVVTPMAYPAHGMAVAVRNVDGVASNTGGTPQ